MIELTEEQRQGLVGENPPILVDPATREAYALIRLEVYERIKALLGAEDLTSEEKLFLLAESGRRAGWDDPRMDDYDHYDESRKKLCP